MSNYNQFLVLCSFKPFKTITIVNERKIADDEAECVEYLHEGKKIIGTELDSESCLVPILVC